MPSIVLTTTNLQGFVGGQCDVRNRQDGYHYCGEISSISVEGEGAYQDLVVEFRWRAKGERRQGKTVKWTTMDCLSHRASLTASPYDIGKGRIGMLCKATGELVILFPAGAGCLDPRRVEGLKLQPHPTG